MMGDEELNVETIDAQYEKWRETKKRRQSEWKNVEKMWRKKILNAEASKKIFQVRTLND